MFNRKMIRTLLLVLALSALVLSAALADSAPVPTDSASAAEPVAPSQADPEGGAEPAETTADPALAVPASEPEAVPSAAPLTAETVLATVGGQDVTYAKVRRYYDALVQNYGSVMDVTDPAVSEILKESALNFAVLERVVLDKANQLGLDQFSESEMQDMRADVDTAYENAFNAYKAQFAASGQSEEEQIKNTEAFLATNGYSKESLLEQLRIAKTYERALGSISGDLTLSEEQIRASFDEKVEQAQTAYAQNKAQFDADIQQGATIYYTPEGVRAVKHILVMMDQVEAARLKAIREELAALPEEDAKRIDLGRESDELLSAIQPKLDEIAAAIEEGKDFQSLIDLYGEDPGMKPGSSFAVTGYYLSESTAIFEAPFTQAALALEKTGDISEPTLGSRGFHIIRYDHDVPSGPASFDEVKAALTESETAAAKKQLEADTIGQWRAEAEVQTYPERFAAQ